MNSGVALLLLYFGAFASISGIQVIVIINGYCKNDLQAPLVSSEQNTYTSDPIRGLC